LSYAGAQDNAQINLLAEARQEVIGQHVELANVDQNYTGENAALTAQEHGSRQVHADQTRVCSAGSTMGRRMQLCLVR
jgi:hypothetical protein